MKWHGVKVTDKNGNVWFRHAGEGEPYEYWILDRAQFDELNRWKGLYDNLELAYISLESEKENSEKDSQAYPKKIESLNRQVVLLQKELDEARSNDATIEKVLRIMKERANKDRGIKGKKDNPGYELISSERYFYSTSKTQGFDMYKTLIQTPFPSELNRSQVIELWKYDDDRCDWFESIGIGVQFDIGNNASYYFFNITKQLEERSDIYISTAFKRNFKTGYWEATIIHNEEIEL